MARQAYDIHAVWDDPFERKGERRANVRRKTRLKASLRTNDTKPGANRTHIRDLSLTGAQGVTDAPLQPGQRIRLAIGTGPCPDHMVMPKAFVGSAEVVRVAPNHSGANCVGLRLEESFTQSMEFALFVDYVHSISSLLSTS